jgi:protein phosphatase PTC1
MRRFILYRRLSFDHKAQDPDERLRVQKLGGFLGDNNRIAGKIAIARSIGDHEFFPLVSSDPFISLTELTPEYKFLIVACDGLWDVMSDQEAVDFVVEYHNKTKSYVGAALLLRDLAFQLGSGDNISIIVFGLHTPELPVCPPPVSSDDAKAAPYEPVSFGNTPTETSLQDVVPPAVSSSATFETIVEESDEPESASFVNAPLAKAEAEVESTSVPAHKEEPKE